MYSSESKQSILTRGPVVNKMTSNSVEEALNSRVLTDLSIVIVVIIVIYFR
jgi:hypothetical protein